MKSPDYYRAQARGLRERAAKEGEGAWKEIYDRLATDYDDLAEEMERDRQTRVQQT
jgi:hypothetical protein